MGCHLRQPQLCISLLESIFTQFNSFTQVKKSFLLTQALEMHAYVYKYMCMYISDQPYVSKYNIQALGIIPQLRHSVHLPTPISND